MAYFLVAIVANIGEMRTKFISAENDADFIEYGY